MGGTPGRLLVLIVKQSTIEDLTSGKTPSVRVEKRPIHRDTPTKAHEPGRKKLTVSGFDKETAELVDDWSDLQ